MRRAASALRAPGHTGQQLSPSGEPGPRGKQGPGRIYPSVPPGEVLALGYASGRAHPAGDESELRQQAAAIDRFCRWRGWELVALVSEVEAPTSRRLSRPSLGYAIERLRTGEASCLVVAELRRLCASVAELGGVLEDVHRAGARLVSLEPAIDTATLSGRAALRALTSVSAWERARRANMIAAAREKAAGPQTIQPKLKRRVLRMRGTGMTLQAIADALNEEGVPTVRGGIEWRPSSVQAALGYKRPRP
jgi:DNA invertase Pin-like site-specific DNA recombinase